MIFQGLRQALGWTEASLLWYMQGCGQTSHIRCSKRPAASLQLEFQA